MEELFVAQKDEAMAQSIRPGSSTPASGQYIQVGPRGGFAGTNEITAVQGKPMPPTSKPGNGYILVDPTKHK